VPYEANYCENTDGPINGPGKASVCCGGLSYKLGTTSPNDNPIITTGEFYVNKQLIESYKEGTVFLPSSDNFSLFRRVF